MPVALEYKINQQLKSRETVRKILMKTYNCEQFELFNQLQQFLNEKDGKSKF